MVLVLNYTNEEVRIKGDEHLQAKLPQGFNVKEINLTGVQIDAESLAKAYNDAETKGIHAIKYYFALKHAFIKKQELSKAPNDMMVDA